MALTRLEQEAHGEDFKDWHDSMSYKVFLLEKELGYQITADMNGLALMERLNMLDRYWDDQKDEHDRAQNEAKNGKGGKGTKGPLMK